jgi:hypothetical protein
MAAGKGVNFNFAFVVPPDDVLAAARRMLTAPQQDHRDIAKAFLDTTEVMTRTRTAVRGTS